MTRGSGGRKSGHVAGQAGGEGVAPSADLAAAIDARIRAELSFSSRVELVGFGEFARTATKTKLVSLEPQ